MISHCAKKLRIGKMVQHRCRAGCVRRNWPAWFKPAVFIPKSSLHINFTGWKMWSRRSCWWKTSRQTWLNHWFCCDACWKKYERQKEACACYKGLIVVMRAVLAVYFAYALRIAIASVNNPPLQNTCRAKSNLRFLIWQNLKSKAGLALAVPPSMLRLDWKSVCIIIKVSVKLDAVLYHAFGNRDRDKTIAICAVGCGFRAVAGHYMYAECVPVTKNAAHLQITCLVADINIDEH